MKIPNLPAAFMLEAPAKSRFSDGFVKRSQARRANPQGVRRTFGYAATTEDAAQRSMRTFYEAVMLQGSEAYSALPPYNATLKLSLVWR